MRHGATGQPDRHRVENTGFSTVQEMFEEAKRCRGIGIGPTVDEIASGEAAFQRRYVQKAVPVRRSPAPGIGLRLAMTLCPVEPRQNHRIGVDGNAAICLIIRRSITIGMIARSVGYRAAAQTQCHANSQKNSHFYYPPKAEFFNTEIKMITFISRGRRS